MKIDISRFAEELRNAINEAMTIISNNTPPDPVLNRHCLSCEFQDRCRHLAVVKDDLSLLSTMTKKERKRLNGRGIFTVSQLSYAFRPRRRPKRLKNKREKYHNSLKALAIQQKKIHIVGKPELKVNGTLVYLDVEGLPDQDFYYLIGVRANINCVIFQRSFWANNRDEENKIWEELLGMLSELKNPALIHYGKFETTFFKRMSSRYGEPPDGSPAAKAVKSTLNLNSLIYAQVYFPTYSNSLKDIAGWLGYEWSTDISSGLQSIIWRTNWEHSYDQSLKETLISYNLEDCEALEAFVETMARICSSEQPNKEDVQTNPEVVYSPLSTPRTSLWRRFSSPISDFKIINEAARWDYQRDRVYVRTDNHVKDVKSASPRRNKRSTRINKEVHCADIEFYPYCGKEPDKTSRRKRRILYDVHFTKTGLRRWVVKFYFYYYWCATCSERFGLPDDFWPDSIYGRNLVALIVYEVVELCIPQTTVKDKLNRLFDLGQRCPHAVFTG